MVGLFTSLSVLSTDRSLPILLLVGTDVTRKAEIIQ